ncbi:MAG: Pyridoxamine 5'-phosphate oxidase-related FMN-binding protein [Candidatus Woesebacteria bacterium GW2011_GWA1_33_30]|uniref:Pyridoxamine 5'-phosphate oxidase-related FMN-binding protein n=1 Tax=Candidatus Woesebacteria bacterium GW2011_GWA2_33_28 TaxID=1618561 RepID=A0A0F9ZVR7_9BACT|nr:MAG: Pyridoxamine 5'-phosphate oxidase-related FMN-binding protein [Candidatus Woesebacteria bacterium GW2011_GWA2_33_28]KKP49081.1 MAG: Pyridoxamine 5'-phosphate oxidase-related FMN-binding protein [Candidatus Woesebacteria bacterium GW2011_GWA1_33_30]KKP50319.1 MAG: Pyridoxamine 5'-phosphate oxidase-related FMN-binding protein [Microgenomates group bacterium GW2011_GWC1_33_32]KKP52672.1 MAG: Pyridoxamine 5'-phosphate oxidase-related FMN-binding protein [Candidatus Woesebacteria bacterium GW
MKLTEKDKKEILTFLGKHKLMSLGTYYKEPWAAPVYYLFDDDLNFYFVSGTKTIHAQNILKNPKVSITIADSKQNPNGKKVGFQARGNATKVTSVSEIKDIIIVWNKRGFVPVTYKIFKKVWKSRFYKVKLNRLQIFDENQTGVKEVRNWKI